MSEAKLPEDLKKMQSDALEKAKEQQAKIDARIKELKTYEGKTFEPNVPNPRFPNQTIKILKYEGVGTLAGGIMTHLFRVESKNPGAIWTPPATKFLEEHHEVEVKSKTTSEII